MTDVNRPDDPRAANRRAWEAVNALHQEAKREAKRRFADPAHTTLDPVLLDALHDLPVAGKALLHTCCNDGEELISAERLGAGPCLGIDFSEPALASARDLAAAVGSRCRFRNGDVTELAPREGERFDVVMITVGTLCWIPDLADWFGRVAAMLVDGGAVVIRELHPVALAFREDRSLDPDHHYFREGAIEYHDSLDYLGKREYDAPPTYEFQHGVGTILSALTGAGFRLERFGEYSEDISNIFAHFVETGIPFPLSMLIIARKEAGNSRAAGS